MICQRKKGGEKTSREREKGDGSSEGGEKRNLYNKKGTPKKVCGEKKRGKKNEKALPLSAKGGKGGKGVRGGGRERCFQKMGGTQVGTPKDVLERGGTERETGCLMVQEKRVKSEMREGRQIET